MKDEGRPTTSGKQRIFFTPVGSEILGIEGSQAWYGDERGLGSVADMSKFFVAGSLKFAVELDEAKSHGKALGLSDSDRDEVIDTWTSWARRHGHILDYGRIKTELTNRANGLPWEPPADAVAYAATQLASAMGTTFWYAVALIKQAMR